MDTINEQTISSELDELAAEAGPDPAEAVANEQAEAAQVASQKGEAEYRELLAQLFGPGFQVLAPAWGVQDAEVDALAGAYAAVLQKYFPEGPGQFGPELAAVFTTVAIIGPRLKMPRTTRKDAGENPENPEPKDTGAGRGREANAG